MSKILDNFIEELEKECVKVAQDEDENAFILAEALSNLLEPMKYGVGFWESKIKEKWGKEND